MNPDLLHSLNSLRILSVDMISYAKSGHPGICLGAAPILFSLFTNHLRVNPEDPNWVNRDRFVMSAGHGSALLYAMLFMAGYNVSIDDLVGFRKLGSKTPGLPDYLKTPGVDATTGPLGQGLATAIGMAMAEKYFKGLLEEQMAKQNIIDYYVYALVSDGDLMEGIATEAASMAGNLALDNLIVLYDSNGITYDGPLNRSSNEEIIRKFISLGWEVDFVSDGNEVKEIDKAIQRAKINKKPTLIEVKTVIGRGSFNEGKNLVHEKPLTKEDMENLRKVYDINTGMLEITENAVRYVRESINRRTQKYYQSWQTEYNRLRETTPNEIVRNVLNFVVDKKFNVAFSSSNFKIQNNYIEELRESNSKIMNIISDRTKFFLGGSADLSSSCHTGLYKEIEFNKKLRHGRNINFGVRENAMGAILNGMSLSGLRTFGSTYLTFADYLKPSIRMTALMNLPVTYIFTHDSVSIGEDGPAYQPIEQLTMLRTIPNLTVFRPADINEVIGCWDYISNNETPVAIVLSKEEAHILAGTSGEKTKLGAYVVRKETERIDAVLVSTGIDLTTTYLISEELRAKGIDTRVVSMPSMNLFLNQSEEYQKEIIPPSTKVFTIEAGSTLIWNRFASPCCAIGIDTFGVSGNKSSVLETLNFDYESILQKIENKIKEN